MRIYLTTHELCAPRVFFVKRAYMRRKQLAVKIVVPDVAKENRFLGIIGGSQQRLAMRDRDDGVELSVEYEQWRFDIADLAYRIEFVLDQQVHRHIRV